jgi:hypothetical protein
MVIIAGLGAAALYYITLTMYIVPSDFTTSKQPSTIIYPIVVLFQINSWIWQLLVFLLIMTALTCLVLLPFQEKRLRFFVFSIFALATIAFLIFCGVLWWIMGLEFRATTTINYASYPVFLKTFFEEEDTFILYECDSLSLRCEPIYESEPMNREGFARTDPPITLRTDESQKTVIFEIDGEIVFTYQQNTSAAQAAIVE